MKINGKLLGMSILLVQSDNRIKLLLLGDADETR